MMRRAQGHYKSGDVVEVRTEEEILGTLDSGGMLNNVPFMEEMRHFCGRRFRVFKRADKVCVEGEVFLEIRRLRDAVLLEDVRCDGNGHDGCKRMCMIFWKEAWLKPVPPGTEPDPPVQRTAGQDDHSGREIDNEKIYVCQSTTLYRATEVLRGIDVRQYARDLRSGALGVRDLMKVFFFTVYNKTARKRGWREFGAVTGREKKTPVVTLNLRINDIAQVNSREEIAATLDATGRNRGLAISYEMLRHSGRTFPVARSVDRMILENTGKMRQIQNTVLLEGTACSGLCVRGCARYSHPMWREAWLRRADMHTPAGEREK